MTTRRDDMASISFQFRSQLHLVVPLILATLIPLAAGFGNEYVHIKVHVPKEESAAEESPHKVIHHFHHHPHPHQLQRNRGRARPKPSPLLESVILSDLDKPLHMSEHADYLNHAKELAEHLTETYAKKPPPPPPPKKKVNTYTIIEEQHRPHGYDYEEHHEPNMETYRVIESRPKQRPHHHSHHHPEEDEEDEDVGYQHPIGGKHTQIYHSLGSGAYAEPAPVEEHEQVEHEPDAGYNYSPPSHSYIPPSHSQVQRNSKINRAPSHTLEAPQESFYPYEYPRPSGGSSSDFRPSVQLPSTDPYGEEEAAENYVTPQSPISRRRRPSLVDWPETRGLNGAAAETYSGVDSYNVGHVQGYGSSGYQYSAPYL